MKNKNSVAGDKKKSLFSNYLRDFFLFNLQTNFNYLRNHIISITNVVVLDGGRLLKVYFSSLSSKNKTDEDILHFLNKKKRQIRFLFGQQFSKKIKCIPQLDFYIDDTMKEVEKIRKYL